MTTEIPGRASGASEASEKKSVGDASLSANPGSMTIAGYLIWKRGLKGWVAEKWPASYQPPHDQMAPVARYPLNAEQYAMSILILEQRFPCTAKLEDEPRVKLEATS